MIKKYLTALDTIPVCKRHGKVLQNKGMVIEATCPDTYIGEICEVHAKFSSQNIVAEVVAVNKNKVLLMPYQRIKGVSQGSIVSATGKMAVAKVGDNLLGRVVDAFGNPIDSKGELSSYTEYPLYKEPINPLTRKAITEPISTGIRAIDSFITIGRGQRMGLFAGSGVGKSTLLAAICHNISEDVNVIALIGERGREVEEFVQAIADTGMMDRTVVISATAEQPPLIRVHAVYTAMAIAEYFSEQGKNVLFTFDSVTRFAMALRELGLSTGEPPTVKGYTPSVFSEIPAIIERCGNFRQRGAISAIFSVLVEGEDFNDPVADCVRAILDGHVVLTRELAERAHYPAIDVLKSTSRLFRQINSATHIKNVASVKKAIVQYQENRELMELGVAGGDPGRLLSISNRWLQIEDFLLQDTHSVESLFEGQTRLATITASWQESVSV